MFFAKAVKLPVNPILFRLLRIGKLARAIRCLDFVKGQKKKGFPRFLGGFKGCLTVIDGFLVVFMRLLTGWLHSSCRCSLATGVYQTSRCTLAPRQGVDVASSEVTLLPSSL